MSTRSRVELMYDEFEYCYVAKHGSVYNSNMVDNTVAGCHIVLIFTKEWNMEPFLIEKVAFSKLRPSVMGDKRKRRVLVLRRLNIDPVTEAITLLQDEYHLHDGWGAAVPFPTRVDTDGVVRPCVSVLKAATTRVIDALSAKTDTPTPLLEQLCASPQRRDTFNGHDIWVRSRKHEQNSIIGSFCVPGHSLVLDSLGFNTSRAILAAQKDSGDFFVYVPNNSDDYLPMAGELMKDKALAYSVWLSPVDMLRYVERVPVRISNFIVDACCGFKKVRKILCKAFLETDTLDRDGELFVTVTVCTRGDCTAQEMEVRIVELVKSLCASTGRPKPTVVATHHSSMTFVAMNIK